MRKDKYLAIRLRKENKSYNDISKILGVPKSTLSGWFKNDKESQKIKIILNSKSNKKVAERIKKFVKNNKEKWEKLREEARIEARKEFSKLIKKPLFIPGMMLYWAEGDSKASNPFRFTNTDPRMISLYVQFLIEALSINKKDIKIGLILYPDLSKEKCVDFWSKITAVPKSQFWKPQTIKGRHPTKRLSNGICIVNCGNRQLKEKVLVWIDLLSKTL